MRRAGAGMFSFLAALLFFAVAHAGDADYDKGVAYLKAGRADEALRLLEPLAAIGGEDPYLYYHLGLAYYKSDRLDKAFDAFARTGAIAKDKAGAEFNLGAAFSNLGIGYYRKKSYDRAMECFDRALGFDPGDGGSHYYLGLTLIGRTDYDAALAELAKAGRLMGDDPKARCAITNAAGMAYYSKEQAGRALGEFKKTLEADPENIEALYYCALLNYKQEGYSAAKPFLDKIIQKLRGAPDEKTKQALFTTFFNMGVDFQNRDQAAQAAEMFERALDLNPGDADAHFYRGYNLASLERYEDASAEFREALAIDPVMTRAKTQLEVSGRFASDKALKEADEGMRRGEYYAALPLYMKAVSLDPANAEAKKGLNKASQAVEKDVRERTRRVKENLAGGGYVKAREGAEELGRLNPGDPSVAALLREVESRIASAAEGLSAKAGEAEGREALGEAAALYEKLLEIRPEDKKAALALRQARARIEDGRKDAKSALDECRLLAAVKAYEKLTRYVPEDKGAADGLAAARERIAGEVASSVGKGNDALDKDDFPKAAFHAGNALELMPQDPGALALRKRIGQRTRELVLLHVKDGESSLERGQKEKAAENFRAALALDPDNESARRGLDKALYVPPQPAPAVARVDEEEVRRLYLQGVEHYTRGELTEAVARWREVLKLDPRNEKAINSINKAEEKLKLPAGKTSQVP